MVKKVLIIDDAFFIRNLIKKSIISKPKKDDYSFEIIADSGNGLEGFELFKKLSPDIVTVDINLPGIKGTEFVSKVKSFNKYANIIVISSNYDTKVQEGVVSSGCVFIKKPFRDEQLWSVLDEMATKNIDEEKTDEIEVYDNNKNENNFENDLLDNFGESKNFSLKIEDENKDIDLKEEIEEDYTLDVDDFNQINNNFEFKNKEEFIEEDDFSIEIEDDLENNNDEDFNINIEEELKNDKLEDDDIDVISNNIENELSSSASFKYEEEDFKDDFNVEFKFDEEEEFDLDEYDIEEENFELEDIDETKEINNNQDTFLKGNTSDDISALLDIEIMKEKQNLNYKDDSTKNSVEIQKSTYNVETNISKNIKKPKARKNINDDKDNKEEVENNNSKKGFLGKIFKKRK